jgi:hypothetical protein
MSRSPVSPWHRPTIGRVACNIPAVKLGNSSYTVYTNRGQRLNVERSRRVWCVFVLIETMDRDSTQLTLGDPLSANLMDVVISAPNRASD